MGKPLGKTARRFLETLSREVSYDPAIPFLGLGPEKILSQNDTCIPIFRAALFTIQDTESTKMSTNRKMKAYVVHL